MAAQAQSAVARTGGDRVPYRLSVSEASTDAAPPPDAATLEAFRKAAWLQPEDPDYHFILGDALLRLDRPAEAVVAFEEATWRRPNEGQYHLALGLALRAVGRPEEALLAFREAERLCPRMSRAHGALGACLLELRRSAEGVEALKSSAALAPDSTDAQLNLGMALVATGSSEDAKVPLRRAIRLDPRQAEGHLQMGAALAATGRTSEAVASFREALRLAPRCLDGRPGLRSTFEGIQKADFEAQIRAEIGVPRESPGAGLGPVAAIVDRLPRALPKVGGLLTTLLLLAALYVTFRVAQPFLVNYMLADEISEAARTPTREDAEVLSGVMEAVERHHLSGAIREGQVRIDTRKMSRRITLPYEAPLVLWPGLEWKLHFTIDAKVPLLIDGEDKVFL